MRCVFDHDSHLHTNLSHCAKSDEQTADRILQYAKDYGLHTICVTDHYWDTDVPFVVKRKPRDSRAVR